MATGLSNVKLGLRVVRGPNWVYGNDIEEGLVGTVVETYEPNGSSSSANCVRVLWDTGVIGRYRAGYNNMYDLCAIDSGERGLLTDFITCNGCRKNGIPGFSWSCSTCPNYYLCSSCYMSDKHDIKHTFYIFEPHSKIGTIVSPRYSSDKVLARGLFKDAHVSRTVNKRWGEVGEGGQVLNVLTGGEITVKWISGSCSTHRLGTADLKCIEPSIAGYYYKNHLPVVGHKNNSLMGATPVNAIEYGRTPQLALMGAASSPQFESPFLAINPIPSPGQDTSPSKGFGKKNECHIRVLADDAQGVDQKAGTIFPIGESGLFPHRGKFTLQTQSGSDVTIQIKFSGNVDLKISEKPPCK